MGINVSKIKEIESIVVKQTQEKRRVKRKISIKTIGLTFFFFTAQNQRMFYLLVFPKSTLTFKKYFLTDISAFRYMIQWI